DASARGDGWVAASKAYVGDLAVEFVLPDAGRFDDVAGHLGAVIADFDQRRSHESAQLAVPRFTTRFGAELSPALKTLGLTALYDPGHLLGIAPADSLLLHTA